MGFISEVKKIFRTRFVAGLLVVVPLILTFVLLRSLVEFIDGLFRPVIIRFLGHAYDIPLVGIFITLTIIIVVGIISANVFGNRLVKFWERQLLKIPVINIIYGPLKQLMQTLSVPQNKSFKSVVLVEYPRKGIYALGFLVNETLLPGQSGTTKLLSVFIPSSPTPISGFVVLFPETDIEYLDMTIEEGIKFFVSGSIISPASLKLKDKMPSINAGNADYGNL